MTKLTNDVQQNIDLVKQLSLDAYPDKPILAALSATQAILEGGLLRTPPSVLALKYSNLFGMKPGFIRTGTALPGTVYLPTHEYIQGKGMVEMDQPFLSNLDVEDSIKQHKILLTTLSRYENLNTATTFQEIAQMVHDDGYATDPNYPNELISVYNEHVK